MTTKIKKVLFTFISAFLITALMPLNSLAQLAQFYENNQNKIKELQITINSNLAINNTGYKGFLPKGSKYDLKNHIPARYRYAHSSAEVRIMVIHGLYPSRYNFGVNNTVYSIRELALLDLQNNYLERTLSPVFTSAHVHEAVYIEALLALAGVAAKGKLKNPQIKELLIKDLRSLSEFTSHELLYGTGKEYDAALRGEINSALKSLGVEKITPAKENSNWSVFNRKKQNVLNKINNTVFFFSILSMGISGVKGGSATAVSAPKSAAALRAAPVRGTVTAPKIVQMRPNISASSYTPKTAFEGSNAFKIQPSLQPLRAVKPAAAPTAAFEGSAALKMQPQIQPLEVVKPVTAPTAAPKTVFDGSAALKTQPLQASKSAYTHASNAKAAASAMPYAPGQIPGVPALLTGYKTSPGMDALGHKLEEIRAANKEQLKHRIRKGGTLTQEDLNGLPLAEQIEVYNEARKSGLLDGNVVLPPENSLGVDTYSIDSPKAQGNLPKENLQWLETIEKHEDGILKNYGLSESYIEGYYTRRIYPYLAKPTYKSNSDTLLYRGMLLTVPELKNIIKNGMELNKTSWHTGAEGNKPIVSVSSNINEAVSYIFQSKLEKTRQGAIGVVVEVKRNDSYKMLEDAELNSTKTIFHTYRAVPADEIVAVYIWGPYGLEDIKRVAEKIEDGTADPQWIKAFDGGFMR